MYSGLLVFYPDCNSILQLKQPKNCIEIRSALDRSVPHDVCLSPDYSFFFFLIGGLQLLANTLQYCVDPPEISENFTPQASIYRRGSQRCRTMTASSARSDFKSRDDCSAQISFTVETGQKNDDTLQYTAITASAGGRTDQHAPITKSNSISWILTPEKGSNQMDSLVETRVGQENQVSFCTTSPLHLC